MIFPAHTFENETSDSENIVWHIFVLLPSKPSICYKYVSVHLIISDVCVYMFEMQMQMHFHWIANKCLYLLPSDSHCQPVFLFIFSICMCTNVCASQKNLRFYCCRLNYNVWSFVLSAVIVWAIVVHSITQCNLDRMIFLLACASVCLMRLLVLLLLLQNSQFCHMHLVYRCEFSIVPPKLIQKQI